MTLLFNTSGEIKIGQLSLKAEFIVPVKCKGFVVFPDTGGCRRQQQLIAECLRNEGYGTLISSLLSEEEDKVYKNRYNYELLAQRLVMVVKWLSEQKECRNKKIGLFATCKNASYAFRAASGQKEVAAIVSVGGRTDGCLEFMKSVEAATLFLTGNMDCENIEMNQQAYFELEACKKLEIINGTENLLDEPETIANITDHCISWYKQYLKQEYTETEALGSRA